MTTAISASPIDHDYTLDDRYARASGRIFLTGIQALVRLALMQRQRDLAAGLNTAGFVSGYRGSPLGGLDLNLWRARQHLAAHHVQFVPGLNEDLAATAVWGSQQVNLWPGAKYDGVFGMWYGKGPGVDRCGDVFKHANAAGTSRHGGVLALAGDDHACRSSTLPHQSEHEFVSAMMPILNPASISDILAFGLYGFALSRFTGRWVGFKTIAETVESSASIDVNPLALDIAMPDDFGLPEGDLNLRWPDAPMDQEQRLHHFGLNAARAFARRNRLDRIVMGAGLARLGIVTCGKSYLDVLQALEDLGLDRERCEALGIRIYKVAMSWPLEPQGLAEFVDGLDDILVVEEKRSFIEKQIKEQLFNLAADKRPSVVGKFDERGQWLLPSVGELTPAMVARAIAGRLARFHRSPAIDARLQFLADKEQSLQRPRVQFARAPHFCSGCPHNTSTQVPEGSRAVAGIGCHYMTVWMDRRTETFTQMGGEGVPWIGQSSFTDVDHVFVNLGDGTYFHSGTLAIRALVAAKVNATFKILYNDAVAMTGGQPVDGTLSVPDIAKQVRAEGVQTIVVMSDDIAKWSNNPGQFPANVSFEPREQLDTVQQRLREVGGISVLIYDQTCAAEKRRRRKRGLMHDPAKRAFINQRVCEGCGHCGQVSNCLSIIPVETDYGRKRQIDQSSCNKDFSCVQGFCPSFVTVHGGKVRKPDAVGAIAALEQLPMPTLPVLEQPYDMLITGVGGTGVVTIGALLGMAAHLEGKGVTVLDQTGLAQKFGAVTSHVRIAAKPADIHAVRIVAGGADMVLGCDMVVAGERTSLAKMRRGQTRAVINTNEAMPGTYLREPDLEFPTTDIRSALVDAVGAEQTAFVDATRLATALMGDAIASNLFMLGYAWQSGLVPVSLEALQRAIELNGVAIEANRQAFAWGRLAVVDIAQVEQHAFPQAQAVVPDDIESVIARRAEALRQYQNDAYAERYLNRVRQARAQLADYPELTRAVVDNYYKLMAYKDEYEVARLYASNEYRESLDKQFIGGSLRFYLSPPLIARHDPATGLPKKYEFGSWMLPAFKLLAKFKGLRGSAFDIFGYTQERRDERALITEYEAFIDQEIPHTDAARATTLLALARLPAAIRGYGPIKEKSMAEAAKKRQVLVTQLQQQPREAVDA